MQINFDEKIQLLSSMECSKKKKKSIIRRFRAITKFLIATCGLECCVRILKTRATERAYTYLPTLLFTKCTETWGHTREPENWLSPLLPATNVLQQPSRAQGQVTGQRMIFPDSENSRTGLERKKNKRIGN